MECSLASVFDLMEDADISLLVLTDTDSGESRPRALNAADLDE